MGTLHFGLILGALFSLNLVRQYKRFTTFKFHLMIGRKGRGLLGKKNKLLLQWEKQRLHQWNYTSVTGPALVFLNREKE